MTNRFIVLFCGVLTLPALTSCQRASTPAASPAQDAVSAAPVNTAPPPAQNMVMICRNSQSGADVECGSPGAVMVGMRPETGQSGAAKSK